MPVVVNAARTVAVMVQVPNVVGVGLGGMVPPVNWRVVALVYETIPGPQVVVGVPVKLNPDALGKRESRIPTLV